MDKLVALVERSQDHRTGAPYIPELVMQEASNEAYYAGSKRADEHMRSVEQLMAWCIAQRFRIRYTEALIDGRSASDLMDVLDTIDTANAMLEEGSGACATQDHMDANMPMSEAFRDIMGHELHAANPYHADLWNTAWGIAKKEGFHPSNATRRYADEA